MFCYSDDSLLNMNYMCTDFIQFQLYHLVLTATLTTDHGFFFMLAVLENCCSEKCLLIELEMYHSVNYNNVVQDVSIKLRPEILVIRFSTYNGYDGDPELRAHKGNPHMTQHNLRTTGSLQSFIKRI